MSSVLKLEREIEGRALPFSAPWHSWFVHYSTSFSPFQWIWQGKCTRLFWCFLIRYGVFKFCIAPLQPIIHFFTAWDTMTSSTASGHGIENTKTFQTWQVLSSCFSCTLTIFMNLAMAMAKIVFQNLSCQGSFVLLHVFFQYYGQIGSLFILLWFQILPCLQHLLILRFRRTEFHCYALSDTIVVFSIQISFFFHLTQKPPKWAL